MKQFLKVFLKNDVVINVLSMVASLYMRLVFYTTRWTFENFHIPEDYVKSGKGFLTCFWHEKLLMVVFAWKFSAPFSMIISNHKDGKLIAETVKRFHIRWIPGSTRHGGMEAARRAVKKLHNGEAVGITPDGPRGPRHHIHPGVLTLARLAKVDILPLSYATSHYKILNTWDRFFLPLPFARGKLAWGDPVCFQKGQSLREVEKKLTESLSRLEARVSGTC